MLLKRHTIEHVEISEDEETSLLKDDEDNEISGAWLRSAQPVKAYYSNDQRIRDIVDQLYQEISSSRAKKFKSPTAVKETIETIVVNLSLSTFMGQPIRYSRDRNDYSRNKKFSRRNLSYEMVRAVTDGLEALGYIEQALGRSFHNDRTRGSQTRMWASQRLLALFQEYQIDEPDFVSEAEQEPIQLTNKVKIKTKMGKPITKKYHFTYGKNKHTQQMEEDVVRYNNFVSNNRINVILNHNSMVNYNLLFNIIEKYYINSISIVNLLSSYYNYIYNISNPTYYPLLLTRPTIPSPHITQMFSWEALINMALEESKWFKRFVLNKRSDYYENLKTARLNKDKNLEKVIYNRSKDNFKLSDIGLDALKLELNREHLYRVFSRKSFNKGGRFYGAMYQSFSEDIRRNIYINGGPTVELDFKSLHIRMLYHMKGIDYKEDPYSACAGERHKKVFKTACLVSINAVNEEKAMQAIFEELNDRGIPMPAVKNPLKWIIRTIKETHPDIAEFICRDMGVVLQNRDSHIMNNILMHLLDRDILGLPIHDSIIVQERHEQVLREIMLEEYENEMGFPTEVDKK